MKFVKRKKIIKTWSLTQSNSNFRKIIESINQEKILILILIREIQNQW